MRVVMSPSASGARQMAVDEALLELCARDPGGFTPVLRLYRFEPACLTLGYFQPLAAVDLGRCARDGVEVVRRPTGGRAVLHDRDLTYAVIAPADGPVFTGGVSASARRIGAALLAAVRALGGEADLTPRPPSLKGRGPGDRSADCFAAAGAYELAANGRKLAGSAQVRRGGAALQHGAIRLRPDAGDARPYLVGASGTGHGARGAPGAVPARGGDGGGLEPRSSRRPASLGEMLGRVVGFAEAAEAVAAAMAAAFEMAPRAEGLSAEERRRADELERGRYRDPGWLGRT